MQAALCCIWCGGSQGLVLLTYPLLPPHNKHTAPLGRAGLSSFEEEPPSPVSDTSLNLFKLLFADWRGKNGEGVIAKYGECGLGYLYVYLPQLPQK